ncbi:MAG: penicillin-binding protein 2 [Candidatus Delongbacteria bacterium]|nr:penicillin-binding protein 2 [Candidatus Delongbacteria bacterium]MBN2836837.1 penicillin-binding protein 2 [Candidatus Delongbacteria bacterium]
MASQVVQDVERNNSIKVINTRLCVFIILLGFSLFFAVYKLYDVQIVKHEYYSKLYHDQAVDSNKISAPRGIIYDRRGVVLAENSGELFKFGIRSSVVDDVNSFAEKISSITGETKNKYIERLDRSGFVYLEEAITSVTKEKIFESLTGKESSGVSFTSYRERIYPKGKLACHVLGYVDSKNRGKEGIEKTLDEHLTGVDGYEFARKSARNNITTSIFQNSTEPEAGDNVILTIDNKIQKIAQDELKKCVEKWKAKKASCIVADPKTGEILVMASYPDFDPNEPSDDAFARKNKTITDVYEPGSVMKSITAAMLINENLVKEDDYFFCSNSGIKIAGATIRDSHHNKIENMSFKSVLAQSSNVGTVSASMRITEDKFFTYLRSFGFGNRTNINITGESEGILPRVSSWSALSKPTMSFGQGISSTILQVTMAYCVLANGGNLLEPQIVKAFLHSDDSKEIVSPRIIRRDIITPETAMRVRKMLTEVVTDEGTAKEAFVEGLHVCGKTGTSQKVVDGRYSDKYYDASFVGMFPYEDPKYVITVVVDSPLPVHYGGKVAGPVFNKIATAIQDFYGIDREYKEVKSVIPDLNLKRIKTEKAINRLNDMNFSYRIEGNGEFIIDQKIIKSDDSSKKDIYVLITGDEQRYIAGNIDEEVNAIGMSLSDGYAKVISKTGGKIIAIGSGNIVKQSFSNDAVPVCTLYCKTNEQLIMDALNETSKNIR